MSDETVHVVFPAQSRDYIIRNDRPVAISTKSPSNWYISSKIIFQRGSWWPERVNVNS